VSLDEGGASVRWTLTTCRHSRSVMICDLDIRVSPSRHRGSEQPGDEDCPSSTYAAGGALIDCVVYQTGRIMSGVTIKRTCTWQCMRACIDVLTWLWSPARWLVDLLVSVNAALLASQTSRIVYCLFNHLYSLLMVKNEQQEILTKTRNTFCDFCRTRSLSNATFSFLITWRSSSSKSAALFKISSKSDDFLLRYGEISIFKMAAVHHLEIILPPHETTHEVCCWPELLVRFHVNLIVIWR